MLRRGDPEQSGISLELFQRVITVSIEIMKIVRKLPKLEVIELEE